jgi:hypothetical protein
MKKILAFCFLFFFAGMLCAGDGPSSYPPMKIGHRKVLKNGSVEIPVVVTWNTLPEYVTVAVAAKDSKNYALIRKLALAQILELMPPKTPVPTPTEETVP